MIKRLLIFLVAFGIFELGIAQSLQVSVPNYTIVGGYTSFLLEATAVVTNVSSTTKNVKVRRVMVQEVPNSENQICWGVNCYAPFIDLTPSAEPLAPNVPNNTFKGDYAPLNQSGITIIRYVFFDDNNVNDSTAITITYDATNAVASVKVDNPVINFASDPAPNPAINYTDIQYRFAPSNETPSLKVFNINGKVVREVKMPSNEGNLKLSVSGMESGLYFYQFYSGNASTAVKKLIVN